MLPLWFVASLASCLLFHLWSQESAHFRGSLFSLAEVEKGQFNLVQMCCCAFWCFFWLIELFIFDIFCWVIAAKSTPTVMSWCINSSDCTSIIIYLPKTVVSPLSPITHVPFVESPFLWVIPPLCQGYKSLEGTVTSVECGRLVHWLSHGWWIHHMLVKKMRISWAYWHSYIICIYVIY